MGANVNQFSNWRRGWDSAPPLTNVRSGRPPAARKVCRRSYSSHRHKFQFCSRLPSNPTGASKRTERVGFEPTNRLSAVTRFPIVAIQPLSHLSKVYAAKTRPKGAGQFSRLGRRRKARRGGDSNSRGTCAPTAFRERRLRPLEPPLLYNKRP